VGFQGEAASPSVILAQASRLHVELHAIESTLHWAGRSGRISDIVLESAITTIQDCEDSVAAVSTDDKVRVYRNWLGLMKARWKRHWRKAAKRCCDA